MLNDHEEKAESIGETKTDIPGRSLFYTADFIYYITDFMLAL